MLVVSREVSAGEGPTWTRPLAGCASARGASSGFQPANCRVESNWRVLAHTRPVQPRAMSSATKPRRSLNGGTSPSRGRGRSPPREREMAQRNHRRGERTPSSSAFGSAPSQLGGVVFAIFPPKPMRGSAPPLAPFPSTSPLTRRVPPPQALRLNPSAKPPRTTTASWATAPPRRRSSPEPARTSKGERARISPPSPRSRASKTRPARSPRPSRSRSAATPIDPMVMHPSAEWRRYWDGHFNFIVLVYIAYTVPYRLASTCPRWAAGTCSSSSSTSTTGSTS